jgi:hypothetical protein
MLDLVDFEELTRADAVAGHLHVRLGGLGLSVGQTDVLAEPLRSLTSLYGFRSATDRLWRSRSRIRAAS